MNKRKVAVFVEGQSEYVLFEISCVVGITMILHY